MSASLLERPCLSCGTDISYRHGLAKRCESCARGVKRKRKRTPEQRERDLTASRARYRRVFGKGSVTCEDCGGPAARCKNEVREVILCVPCFGARRKIWTEATVIEAIQDFRAIYGRLPSAQDWNPSMARNNGRMDLVSLYYRDGCWPPTSAVANVFGRWSLAIEAAGFVARKIGERGPTSEFVKRSVAQERDLMIAGYRAFSDEALEWAEAASPGRS